MAIIPQMTMFDYDQDLKDYGDLERLRMVLCQMPDGKLVQALAKLRGPCGRDDYPVRMMWNAVLAGIVFQHPSVESLLRELRRNAQLRWVVSGGVMSSGRVPTSDAMSRFLKRLVEMQGVLDLMFQEVLDELKRILPGLGERLAMDSKMIASCAPGERRGREGDLRGEHDARWGTKTYTGTRENGTVWEKVMHTFGFKLHLIVDSVYELPLSFMVTPANGHDLPAGMKLIEQYKEQSPALYGCAEYLSADRGYDAQELVESLAMDKIRSIIDTRELWKGTSEKPLLDYDNLTYTEKGVVYCACPMTATKRRMGNLGYEEGRDSVRKQCPMMQYQGLVCEGAAHCLAANRSIRLPRKTDPRVFQRVPRDSHKWKREYRKRTAVERVNSRLDVSFGFERHTIRGQKKMRLRMSLAMLVMLTLALAHLKAVGKGCETYRSLVRMPA